MRRKLCWITLASSLALVGCAHGKKTPGPSQLCTVSAAKAGLDCSAIDDPDFFLELGKADKFICFPPREYEKIIIRSHE